MSTIIVIAPLLPQHHNSILFPVW